MTDPALPVHERPFTSDRYSTAELPDTPTRSFRIPASSWIEAPEQVLRLGDDLGEPVEYKRRIGEWLLWRAGPAVGRARYMAISEDCSQSWVFELDGKRGQGSAPDGRVHERFRTWKEGLLANPPADR